MPESPVWTFTKICKELGGDVDSVKADKDRAWGYGMVVVWLGPDNNNNNDCKSAYFHLDQLPVEPTKIRQFAEKVIFELKMIQITDPHGDYTPVLTQAWKNKKGLTFAATVGD